MESIRFRRWCSLAVSGIRYKPDRERVYAELYGHMEDRYEALTEAGVPPEEAESRVLAAMGSAEETSNILERVHRPYWAWALWAARCLLLIALLLALLSVPRWIMAQDIVKLPEGQRETFALPYREAQGIRDTRTFYAKPMSRASSDGYRFILTCAAGRHIECDDPDWIEEHDEFYLAVEVFNLRPWAQNNDLLREFRAADSLGNVYGAYNRSPHDSETPVLQGTPYRTGLCTVTWVLFLRNYRSQGAEWIELRYDTGGRGVRLCVDMTGGGAG